jgi:hypothetical protein
VLTPAEVGAGLPSTRRELHAIHLLTTLIDPDDHRPMQMQIYSHVLLRDSVAHRGPPLHRAVVGTPDLPPENPQERRPRPVMASLTDGRTAPRAPVPLASGAVAGARQS